MIHIKKRIEKKLLARKRVFSRILGCMGEILKVSPDYNSVTLLGIKGKQKYCLILNEPLKVKLRQVDGNWYLVHKGEWALVPNSIKPK